jgi:hypothetical protein
VVVVWFASNTGRYSRSRYTVPLLCSAHANVRDCRKHLRATGPVGFHAFAAHFAVERFDERILLRLAPVDGSFQDRPAGELGPVATDDAGRFAIGAPSVPSSRATLTSRMLVSPTRTWFSAGRHH